MGFAVLVEWKTAFRAIYVLQAAKEVRKWEEKRMRREEEIVRRVEKAQRLREEKRRQREEEKARLREARP